MRSNSAKPRTVTNPRHMLNRADGLVQGLVGLRLFNVITEQDLPMEAVSPFRGSRDFATRAAQLKTELGRKVR